MAINKHKKVNKLSADEAKVELHHYHENNQLTSSRAVLVRRRLEQLGVNLPKTPEKQNKFFEGKLTVAKAVEYVKTAVTISQTAFVKWARGKGLSRDGAREMFKQVKAATPAGA